MLYSSGLSVGLSVFRKFLMPVALSTSATPSCRQSMVSAMLASLSEPGICRGNENRKSQKNVLWKNIDKDTFFYEN